MSKTIDLKKYSDVKILSDNLLVLYEENYQNLTIVKKENLESIYPDQTFCGIITIDDSDTKYYSYLKKENLALVEKKVENPSGIRITENNQIRYNNCYEIMRSPIDLSTGKFIYPGIWYQFWDYSTNFDKCIFVRGGDSFGYQILNKKDGKPLLPGKITFYEPCPKFQTRTYKITRSDGMVALFDTYYAKLVFGNKWLKDCTFLSKFSYILTYEDGLKQIAQVYGDYKFQTDLFDICEQLNEYLLKVRISGENLCTIIKTEDFSPLYNNLCFKNWKDWSNTEFLVTREDGLSTLISKCDGKFVFNENAWFKKWKMFFWDYGKIQVTREDGLSTLFDRYTGTIINQNLWYKNFEWFINETLIATQKNGLSTLIDNNTFEVIYKTLLFKKISKFSSNYYLIIDKNDSKNLIKISDGTPIFDFYISPEDSVIIELNEKYFLIKDGNILKTFKISN